MSKNVIIWWLRQDLRGADNPALVWAAERGKVLPVYIVDENHGRSLGGASKWWLEQSLRALRKDVPVVVKRGPVEEVLQALVAAHKATAVVWNRCYEPWAVNRDTDIKALLKDEIGVEVQSFNSALLHEPWEVKTLAGKEYKVFTPYWNAASAMKKEAPCPAPKQVEWVREDGGDTGFYPVKGEPDWAAGWDKEWEPGEAGAQKALARFVKDKMADYVVGRDLPAQDLTSKLSPHLHFGEIGPRQIWAAVKAAGGAGSVKFLAEIGWREFAHHLLYHYPSMADSNWKREFDRYPWRKLEGAAMADFEAWKQGKTGYPLVDAGMRQMWQTGWMHNRVRMVAASFLVKHLRIDWREGERWFWDTLVDADGANNITGWQWVAGSGADASPYFRVFNPTAQAERFDPQQEYIKRWVPEVGTKDYVPPIVQHEVARAAALEGYKALKG